MTTPERWQRVQELCETLDTTAAEGYEARLLELESDESVRREVLALLQSGADEQRLQRQLVAEARAANGVAPVIGGVRILERLGSGGSSDVYRGVRLVNGTEQVAAVKCFHPHRARTDQLDRFTREQRLLASLTHPDIVRFFDAGVTADDRPYFIMELVDGQPITEYCDGRLLRIRDRLRLMLTVCDALQSAHQHLIVHLDLKPSNVLVTADGRAKLLDFGCAKLLDAAGTLTRTEPLTLMYASPERLRGEAVSVACDVYGVGLILYELLSGGWPFARRDSIVSVAERAVGEVRLTPLSASVTDAGAQARGTARARLQAGLRGDLEAICDKALAYLPKDRYASVAELREDLRRYLDAEPVRARPLAAGYRAAKFVRRHVWAVAGGAILVTGLTGAAIYSVRQARVAEEAATRASVQNGFLTTLFTLSGQDSESPAGMTVQELLTLAQARVAPDLGTNTEAAADVEALLARGFIAQNAFREAATLLDHVVATARQLGSVPREANALAMLAYANYVQNRNEIAGQQAHLALTLWTDHAQAFTVRQAVPTIFMAASTLSYLNPIDPAPARHFEACLDLARPASADVPDGDRAQCLQGLAVSYMNIESRYDEADALMREAVAIGRAQTFGADRLSGALQILGLVNRYRGHFAEDEAAQRQALEILERLQGADSRSAIWQRAVWITSLSGVGRAEEAYALSKKLIESARRLYPDRGSYLLWTPLSAGMTAACMSGRMPECEALAREALTTLGPTPSDQDARTQVARGFLGLALAARGEMSQARPLLDGAIAMNVARKRTPPYLELLRDALKKAGDDR